MSRVPPKSRGKQSKKKVGFDANQHENVDVVLLHTTLLREMEEPKDGHEGIPFVWLMATIALSIGCGFYLASFAAGFSSRHYDGNVVAATGDTPSKGAIVAAVVDPMVLGKRVYNNCMACHQSNGAGLAKAFPPLQHSEWVLGSPNRLIRILLQGLGGKLTVQGYVYNGVMPAWNRLSNEDIAAVLTYIRQSFGNQADTITADAVEAVRQQVGGRSEPWTEAELLATP